MVLVKGATRVICKRRARETTVVPGLEQLAALLGPLPIPEEGQDERPGRREGGG